MNKYEEAYNTINQELLIANIILPHSVSHFKELVERATPKKVEQEFGYHDMICPSCGYKIEKRYSKFHEPCGQALDWD